MKKLFLFLALTLSSSASFANDASVLDDFGVYVGAGLGFINTQSSDAFGGDVSFKVGEVLGGVHWRWIGLEARTGQSSEDEVIDIGQDPNTGEFVTARTALSNYDSIFLRLQLENEIARIYLLYGQSEVYTSSTFSTGEIVDVTDTGDAYGLGVGFEVNPHLFFNLEYKSLYNSQELSLPMVGATIDFHVF